MKDKKSKHPAISVIIPYGGGNDVTGLIFQVMPQLEEFDEIILVVDGVEPPSLQSLTKLQMLTILSLEERHGPAYSRNRGAETANGDILLFMDSDIRIGGDLIEAVRALDFSNRIIFGPIVNSQGFLPFPLADSPSGHGFYFACVAITKPDFFVIGGFCQLFKLPFREDSEFFYRALKKNFSVRFLLVIDHPSRRTQLSTYYSILKKSMYEPLYHRLIRGENRWIETYGNSKQNSNSRHSFTMPNKFGFSDLILLVIALFSLFTTSLLLNVFIPFIVSFLTLILISMMVVNIRIRRPGLGVRLVYPFHIVIYFAAVSLGRIFGSVKFRHFTL